MLSKQIQAIDKGGDPLREDLKFGPEREKKLIDEN